MVAKAYWWSGRPNFGDLLTPMLLRRFSKLEVHWTEPNSAEIVVAGSVLEHLPDGWRGIVAGAGKLHDVERPLLAEARVLAFRGPLSAKGWRKDVVLADPGLLADELIEPVERVHNLGLVPHWTDHVLATRREFLRFDPLIVDVTADPYAVIAQIASCKKIVTSSLHGAVLADALGIPRRIEIAPLMLSNPAREGGLFKWRDYSASLGTTLEVGRTVEVDRNRVIEKQHELFDVFSEVRSLLS